MEKVNLKLYYCFFSRQSMNYYNLFLFPFEFFSSAIFPLHTPQEYPFTLFTESLSFVTVVHENLQFFYHHFFFVFAFSVWFLILLQCDIQRVTHKDSHWLSVNYAQNHIQHSLVAVHELRKLIDSASIPSLCLPSSSSLSSLFCSERFLIYFHSGKIKIIPLSLYLFAFGVRS